MKAVGIKLLKARLSEYVRAAAAGETILVLDREQVVAQLAPPSPGRQPHVQEEWKAEMIRRGELTPAVKPYVPRPTSYKRYPLDEIMRDLDASREDRF